MSIEVGNILPGKITGITNFGAFVDLGNRKTGLVHISEVSNSTKAPKFVIPVILPGKIFPTSIDI